MFETLQWHDLFAIVLICFFFRGNLFALEIIKLPMVFIVQMHIKLDHT